MLYLYHYYESTVGAFKNLSELDPAKALEIQGQLTGVFAAQRDQAYLSRRRYLEGLVRDLFLQKGGRPERQTPYYMVVGECPWLETWYKHPAHLRLPIDSFDLRTLSFTYGDTFPTFSERVTDGLEYRKTVYTYDEILDIIQRYGLPQDKWRNPVFGQPAYVEAQVWSDQPITPYRDR